MNLRRVGMLLTLAALVLLVAFVAYHWLNTAVSLDHARQEQHLQRDRAQLLRSILEHMVASRLSRTDLLQLLREDFGKGHIIKEQGDRIEVDDIVFKLREDRIVEVVFMGEEDPSRR